MKTAKHIALIGVAASVIIAGTALAKPKADTNQDGQISKAEFVAAADAKFASTDANGDGVITEDERKAGHEARKAERANARFEKLDANGDGFVSRDEHEAAGEKMRERKEERRAAKGDGTADKEARKEMRKERRKDKGKKGEGRIKHDANEDGVVTLAEHQAATDAMFLRLDANGDGVLTKGEGKQRKRGKRGGRR